MRERPSLRGEDVLVDRLLTGFDPIIEVDPRGADGETSPGRAAPQRLRQRGIIAPFRRYIPPVRGLRLRWVVRLAVLILAAFRWVPVAGGLAAPKMDLISNVADRGADRRLAPGT